MLPFQYTSSMTKAATGTLLNNFYSQKRLSGISPLFEDSETSAPHYSSRKPAFEFEIANNRPPCTYLPHQPRRI